MSNNRLTAPVTAALNIQEQYHKDVLERLRVAGIDEDSSHSIVTDIYAKDDIYFSLNRHYKPIEDGFLSFLRAQGLHPRLEKCFPASLRLYKHQARAIESIQAGKTTIIATGTGSGKTESFLIPILDHCLRQRTTAPKGIKALILYPLNALASDQIRRILDAVKGTGIRVGCFVGSTPETLKDRPRTEKDQSEHVITREEMINDPPDILITNFVMLDRLITKNNTRSMFTTSAATLRYVVVDELHYFRGTKGTNLSLLLRRLHTFCQQPLLYIGASGTLKRSGGYYPDSTDENIKTFIKQVFGKGSALEEQFKVIEPDFLPLEEARLDPLPATDDIDGDPFFNHLDATWAQHISDQLFGSKYQSAWSGSSIPGYEAASHSLFIQKMQEKLSQGACTLDDFVVLFTELYQEAHHNTPHNPRRVVEAYWSLINYLNQRRSEKAQPPFLDYRLHIILNNIGEELTRCLLCGKYHDERCSYCRSCNNGLLFRVSRTNPKLCIAYLSGNRLFPQKPHSHALNTLPVLAEYIDPSLVSSTQAQVSLIADIQPLDELKYYLLSPAQPDERGVNIQYARETSDLQPLLLSAHYTYWLNVLKVTDALVLDPQICITDKLLSFIDNKEQASNIKVRLNDEIADRILSQKAALIWQESGPILNLQDAFEHIANRGGELFQDEDDEDEVDNDKKLFASLEQEFPFWFNRMLSYTDRQDMYRYWRLSIMPGIAHDENEQDFLDMLLEVGAIDRTCFWAETGPTIQHFHLDKARITTEYGVGAQSISEQGQYAIYSLGDQGRRFREIIKQLDSQQVESMLESLMQREIIVRKETPAGISFYQLCPEAVSLEVVEDLSLDLSQTYPIIECHTADHSDQERTCIEKDFNDDKIRALVCTPTLEMGVDIGRLSSVLMIGFPPSPANYIQRAGRAGRGNGKGIQNRLATIVTLAAQDAHNQYYYADPRKMIDGEVTPPQLSLSNYSLLTAHTLAYLTATANTPQLLTHPMKLEQRVQEFCRRDPLQLRLELDEAEYDEFIRHLQEASSDLAKKLAGQRVDWEDCYRQRIFPDYGFRQDGTPLLDNQAFNQNNGSNTRSQNEEEDRVLTAREPEIAPRKLVPGRTLFCSGRVVKIAAQQPELAYHTHRDPHNQPFRTFRYLVIDPTTNIHVERRQDADTLYRVSRLLQIAQELERFPHVGPNYCHIYYIQKGQLYFINEGEIKSTITPFADDRGTYRIGTQLKREGLLIRFADSILPTSFKANLLAVLLRCIPDYCNLDDSELRILQHINIHTPSHQAEAVTPTRKESYAFLYGQDESKLVPFPRIFQAFQEMLNLAYMTLQNCTCKGKGCYLCLFSLNSSSLMGQLSHQHAMDALEAFLQYALLRPYIAVPQTSFFAPDMILTLGLRGKICYIRVENPQTGQKDEYQKCIEEDQNTTIYQHLLETLEREWQKGSRSAQMFSSLDHIVKQLQSENTVKKGQEAFVKLRMHLLSWQNWTIDHTR